MKKVFNGFSIALLIFLALITVFPFLYMVMTGLMTYAEATSIPPSFIPSSFKISNYLEVFSRAPFLRYFGNTLFVSLFTTVATVITSLLAAFAVTSLQFKGKNIVMMILVSLLMVPYEHLCSVNHSVLNKYLLYLLLERVLKRNPKHILQSC